MARRNTVRVGVRSGGPAAREGATREDTTTTFTFELDATYTPAQTLVVRYLNAISRDIETCYVDAVEACTVTSRKGFKVEITLSRSII